MKHVLLSVGARDLDDDETITPLTDIYKKKKINYDFNSKIIIY